MPKVATHLIHILHFSYYVCMKTPIKYRPSNIDMGGKAATRTSNPEQEDGETNAGS